MKVNVTTRKDEREPSGLARLFVEVPELGETHTVDIGFEELLRRCGVPDELTLDALCVASACYAIDKVVSRAHTFDNWTRELEVSFPVSSPKAWRGVADDFRIALRFLTGDLWEVSFVGTDAELFKKPEGRTRRRAEATPEPTPADAVCLLSGGLDSLTGAIDLIASREGGRVLLVGHYDTSGRKTQRDLFADINGRCSGRAELIQTRIGQRPRRAAENTLRSRSLIFMALGVYAARASGDGVPLYAPENGLIAINVPLTPARSGSCSTRTMHPYFLGRLSAVFKGLGFGNRIVNPFRLKTKGECLAECADQSLLRALADLTVSCSHASRKQHWVRRGAKNCGYCYPCLIRRASMHRAGLDRGQSYGVDVCRGEMSADEPLSRADDLRAVLSFLRAELTPDDLEREVIRIAPVDRLEETAKMLRRGFDEIRALLRDKGDKAIRQAAGLTAS